MCLSSTLCYDSRVILNETCFVRLAKSTDNDKEAVPNSTVEDSPGDGFTILSAKSLFLGQKASFSSHLQLIITLQATVCPIMVSLEFHSFH